MRRRKMLKRRILDGKPFLPETKVDLDIDRSERKNKRADEKKTERGVR
jgi:hypothetical protein